MNHVLQLMKYTDLQFLQKHTPRISKEDLIYEILHTYELEDILYRMRWNSLKSLCAGLKKKYNHDFSCNDTKELIILSIVNIISTPVPTAASPAPTQSIFSPALIPTARSPAPTQSIPSPAPIPTPIFPAPTQSISSAASIPVAISPAPTQSIPALRQTIPQYPRKSEDVYENKKRIKNIIAAQKQAERKSRKRAMQIS